MRAITLATLCILAVLSFGRVGQAAFECADTTWEGTSEFLEMARETFGIRDVVLVSELDYQELSPNDRIIIFYPQVRLDAFNLTAFLEAGGRVAVLDDFGTSEGLLEGFGIRRAMAPLLPRDALKNNANLPIAVPFPSSTPGSLPPSHPLLAGVDRVVLNHPTVLNHPDVTPVLQIPTKDGHERTVALTAVVGEHSLGRLVVVSDPSAFINLMLRYPGNRAFASGLIRYLAETHDPKVKRGNLYIVTNRFKQRGSFGGSHSLLARGQSFVRDLPNQLAQPWPRAWLLVCAGLLALGIVRWALHYGAFSVTPQLPRYVRPIPLVAQAGWPGHAAVLTAATTSPTLALVEYKRGFEEQLSRALGLSHSVAGSGLLAEIERRGVLDRPWVERLRALQTELAKAERAVVARRDLRVPPSRLAHIRQEGLDILARFSQGRTPTP